MQNKSGKKYISPISKMRKKGFSLERLRFRLNELFSSQSAWLRASSLSSVVSKSIPKSILNLFLVVFCIFALYSFDIVFLVLGFFFCFPGILTLVFYLVWFLPFQDIQDIQKTTSNCPNVIYIALTLSFEGKRGSQWRIEEETSIDRNKHFWILFDWRRYFDFWAVANQFKRASITPTLPLHIFPLQFFLTFSTFSTFFSTFRILFRP